MADRFVPEADALDQQREVDPTAAPPEHDRDPRWAPALEYPDRMPADASEGDVLEQNQDVDYDEEEEGDHGHGTDYAGDEFDDG
jgi:hypothetical protein